MSSVVEYRGTHLARVVQGPVKCFRVAARLLHPDRGSNVPVSIAGLEDRSGWCLAGGAPCDAGCGLLEELSSVHGSEFDSRAKLNVPWAGHFTPAAARLPKLICPRNRSRRRDVRERKIEDGVVGNVGDHCLDEELRPLANGEVLNDADVVQVQAGPFQDVRARVAVPPRRRYGESRSIEPLVAVSLVGRIVAIGDAVRAPTRGVRVGWVGTAETRREILPALEIRDPAKLPAAESLLDNPWRGGHESPAFAERQVVRCIDHRAMPRGVVVAAPPQVVVRVLKIGHVVHVRRHRVMGIQNHRAHLALNFDLAGVVLGLAVRIRVRRAHKLRPRAPVRPERHQARLRLVQV